MMAEPIVIHPEDPIHLTVEKEIKVTADMIEENLSAIMEEIKVMKKTPEKEFYPPAYPRPVLRNSLMDLKWLVEFCNNVAPDGANVRLNCGGNYLSICYPVLSQKQMKFLVNRIVMREKLGLEDWIWFFCRESIRNSKKIILYCCTDGLFEDKIDKTEVSFDVANLLETVIDAWMHIQLNEDDLWLNGKGEPDPEEDHHIYWKEKVKKRRQEEMLKRQEEIVEKVRKDAEKAQHEAMKMPSEEMIKQRNSEKFRQKQLNSMFC